MKQERKILRWYQSEAVEAIKQGWSDKQIPYANCAPGSGKSLMLADLTEWALNKGGRVLQLVPKLEHVEQNYTELYNHSEHKHDIGICCAQLGKFQTNRKAVVATMTSFLRRRHSVGKFNVLLIDELHNVSNDPKSGYRKIVDALLKQNPKLLIAGVSGTPYRLGQGLMHDSCLKGPALFTHQVYETPIKRMIEEGFLCHIESLSGDVEIDLEGVKLSGMDYDTTAMGVKFDAICSDAVADMKLKFDLYDIQTAIIFTSNVANAERVAREYDNPSEIRVLHGNIGKQERKDIVKWLKSGSGRRVVVNPNILTEGFDFPALDAVALMRSTLSLRLYVQMVTRVIRAHSEKEKGYVIDYGQNIETHGPIDATNPPKPKKKRGEMPKKPCLAVLDENIEFEGVQYRAGEPCEYGNLLSAKKCKKCGAEFISESEDGRYSMRTKAQILQSKRESSMETYQIDGVYFERAYSRKSSEQMVKMLFYEKEHGELVYTHCLCLDHAGTARINAIKLVNNLLKSESDFYEISKIEGGCNVENMLMLLQDVDTYRQYFKTFDTITIMPDGRFKSLVKYTFKAE